MTSAWRPGGLWVDGSLTLRLDGGAARRIDRPFVLVGRTEGADVRIMEPAVSGRHAYLQLDRRGLFVLDLASARGLRLDGAAVPAGWLAPGGVLEIADHRLEILELVVDGHPLPASIRLPDRRPTDGNDAALARVVLLPTGSPSPAAPWTLNSELVILGRSPACGVPIQGTTAERVHAAILRTEASAYVVNLAGWGLWLNGRAIGPAAALADGDELTAGTSRFTVGITPVPTPEAPLPVLAASSAAATSWPIEILPPPPPGLVPAEAQTALLAWMMGAVQAVQTEAIRRQDAFQVELLQAVRGLHEHQQKALNTHQERVESIHRELAALREEVRQRFGPANTPPVPRFPPLRLAPPADSAAAPDDPEAATAWLLERAHRLDAENRASWRDLLGRLGPRS